MYIKTDNINKIQALKRKGIKAYVTRKREPENYISLDCIRDYIKSTDTVSYSDTDDAKKLLLISRTFVKLMY